MRIRLDQRSVATIVAALRAWQQIDQQTAGLIPEDLENIATGNGLFDRLDDHEIDDLCDRLSNQSNI